MSEEILINVTPQETRIAVVENGVLQEIYIERTRRRGLALSRTCTTPRFLLYSSPFSDMI